MTLFSNEEWGLHTSGIFIWELKRGEDKMAENISKILSTSDRFVYF